MALRRPAAHLRGAPGWRRSGDGSCWEGFMSEEGSTPVARRQRAPRPRSAVEGRQLDDWLERLRAPPFSSRSSSCGSSSLCGSSLGSRESLRTGPLSPPESGGSWETARIVQPPRKEQPRVSCLGRVSTGWLPVQRRVTMVSDGCNHNQGPDHSAGQVKLKQPITPMFQKTPSTARTQGGETEKSGTSHGFSGGRVQQTPPDADAPDVRQMPEKDGDRAARWRVLRRCWNTDRAPGGAGPTEGRKPHDHQTASAGPWRPTLNVQPVRATAPPCGTNGGPRIQTSAATTTLVPQNPAGFSSITISSRKVSRSASLPGSRPPSPAPSRVTVKQEAAIVKVKEQRVACGPGGSPAPSRGADAVVHRRKATIIKVTERMESCGSSKARRPEYRHSYTEGAYEGSGTWRHSEPRGPPLEPAERPSAGGALHRSTLSLYLSKPSAPTAAHTLPEGSAKAAGQRSDRPPRLLSWYDAAGAQDGVRDPERRASPGLTLITAPDPRSHQTPEEVLALNAAAIIANIKLQRQLSKRKTHGGASERESPQGDADERKTMKHPDSNPAHRPPAVFISLDPAKSPEAVSLQDALQRSRPDFVRRSQGRVRELQRRTRERRELANGRGPPSQTRTLRSGSASMKDNLLKPRDGAITGRDMQPRSKQPPLEVRRKKEEEQKREVCLSNRQKVALFKKRLLDQILQRGSS